MERSPRLNYLRQAAQVGAPAKLGRIGKASPRGRPITQAAALNRRSCTSAQKTRIARAMRAWAYADPPARRTAGRLRHRRCGRFQKSLRDRASRAGWPPDGQHVCRVRNHGASLDRPIESHASFLRLSHCCLCERCPNALAVQDNGAHPSRARRAIAVPRNQANVNPPSRRA